MPAVLTTPYATCPHCGETNDDRRPRTRRSDGTVYYDRPCRPCYNARYAAQRARRNAARRSAPAVPATRLGDARKFGVEIECLLVGGSRGSAAMQLQSLLPRGWRIKTDGSLSQGGVEVVSPPLSGDAGYESLRTACAALRTVGATVNSTCGLHVHHDVSDVGQAGLARFARSWFNNTDLLSWLVSPSRRTNGYCRPLGQYEVEELERWGRTPGSHPNVDRYRAVNAQAYMRFGTVEVRQHQGTVNFRKIESWVRLGQGMLDAVAAQGAPVARTSTLRNLLDRLSVDEDTVAYLLGRALQFGAPAQAVA